MVTPDPAHSLTCDAARSLSFAACDGELNASELLAIETHLQRCASCRVHCLSDAVFLRTIRAAAALNAAPQSLRDRVALILQPHAAENAST
jgi:predicted anti-sigma-YlaC factor YlaD